MSKKNAILSIEDKQIELPLIYGTENETAIDISKLRTETNVVTLDNGFKNTASCESSITFLNGEKGILKHRGYKIEDLANNASFIEVCFLLIFGELPKKKELEKFKDDITNSAKKNNREEIKNLISTFPVSSHPMGILSSVFSALSAFEEEINPDDTDNLYKGVVKIISYFCIISSWIYRHLENLPFNKYNPKKDYVENFLELLFGNIPHKEYKENAYLVKALNQLLILHADHEQNCSTSTVRLVGSSKANLYSAISAGIGALSGPLHGGANQKVIEMLETIKDEGGNIEKYILKAKDKNDPFRLMGFGHRVYKNFDPRATIIKQSAIEFLNSIEENDLLSIARKLEEEALKDDYFLSRNLNPNVDFYSGIIYKAMGIPESMFYCYFCTWKIPRMDSTLVRI